MRLATLRRPGGSTCAARVEGDELVELPYPGVVELLAEPGWERAAGGPGGARLPWEQADPAPAVRPAKVICVGLNYRSHIEEMGGALPEFPTLFAKFGDTLAGPYDDLVIPAESSQVDWEVELGVVVGRVVRHVDEAEAARCIAGYTVVNDISMRDWQNRTLQWLQGKNFEASTPVGPVLVTADEVGDAGDLTLTCTVDGAVMQSGRTSDLLFGPAALVSYVSRFTTLRPGDLIATGTPSGVGAGRNPKVFLRAGQVVETAIDGIGTMRTTCVGPKP